MINRPASPAPRRRVAHIPPGEPAKESAQRRGRPDTTEQPGQRPVPDHSQVIDRAHTGHHAATIEVIFAPAFAASLPALAESRTRCWAAACTPHARPTAVPAPDQHTTPGSVYQPR